MLICFHGPLPILIIIRFTVNSKQNFMILSSIIPSLLLPSPCNSTADLYYDAKKQTVGSVFPTTSTITMQLGCMSFLEYMGFVLVVFPLKCGSIIVQSYIPTSQEIP